jgi:hypothetical protein
MRYRLLLAIAFTLLSAAAAEARLFWQTYGATVPTADGCAWNINQDYFVPRHCDSCRYDLFSACKTSHTTSPACAHLHPVYGGYCTPYGGWHYKRRDHIYRKRCGCTPLRYEYGPWHLEKCKKHCLALRDAGNCGPECGPVCGQMGAGGCEPGTACDAGGCEFAASANCAEAGWLPNVEPFGGESLGSIYVIPGLAAAGGGMGGAAPTGGGQMQPSGAGSGPAMPQPLLPGLPASMTLPPISIN